MGTELATRFSRYGAVFPIRVMDEASAEEGRHGYARLMEADRRFRKKPHLVLPWLARLVRDPAVVEPVAELLGPDVLCWSSIFFAKPARDPGRVAWHQDATYWGLSEPAVVTAWIAFTPSTQESGCLRVVPGTHTAPRLPHRTNGDTTNMLSRGQEIAVEVDEAAAVDIVLRPGEMSIHHVMLVHGSEPNRADHPRIGYAIRYIAGRVEQTADAPDSATLVAGRDHGHFELEPVPRADFDPEAVAAHAHMLNQQVRLEALLG